MDPAEFEAVLRSAMDATSRAMVLGVALDRIADGTDLPPELQHRLDDAVAALGGIPENLSRERAGVLAGVVYANLASASQAFHPAGSGEQTNGVRHMNAVGRASSGFAAALEQGGSQLNGLMERLIPGPARVLDVGVGVAAQAIALADAFPGVSVLGIDVSEAALVQANTNVAKSSCEGRVVLRLQDVLALEDVECFDLVKHSPSFIPERVTRESIPVLLRSLRRGGWLLLPFTPVRDAASAAVAAFKTVLAGGYPWTYDELADLLHQEEFEEVRLFASQGATFAAGRRPLR